MNSIRILLAGISFVLASCASAQAPASAHPTTAASNQSAVFITLGTGGGPLIRRERSEPANAVVVGNAVYLFDVGSGVERQLVGAKLGLGQVRAIFISHHHIDHDADLGQLIASRWMFNHLAPIPVVGPPGTSDQVRALVAADKVEELAPIGSAGPHGKPPIASTVAARDLAPTMDEPTEVYRDENIRVFAVTNTHFHFPPGSPMAAFSRSYSYRIETAGRTFVFTGDTGPSDNVVRLARGADVLVSEVIDLDKMRAILEHAPDLPPPALPEMLRHMQEDHLTPTEVGKLAAAAGVKEVVLTHFAPGMDGESDLSGYTKGIQPTFPGRVRLARDLDRF
jgi:ribonuclease BN (tRNA processing enzyme)